MEASQLRPHKNGALLSTASTASPKLPNSMTHWLRAHSWLFGCATVFCQAPVQDCGQVSHGSRQSLKLTIFHSLSVCGCLICCQQMECLLFALHCKMNEITDIDITHSSCRCAEFPSATMHDEDGIQTTVVSNITLSNSEKNLMAELLASGDCHPMSSHAHHTAQGLCHSPI